MTDVVHYSTQKYSTLIKSFLTSHPILYIITLQYYTVLLLYSIILFYYSPPLPSLLPSPRRNSILLVNGLSVVGAVLMSLSKLAKSFEVLIVGRLVFGVFCGLVMSMNPLYVQEVSPTNLRGAFATLNQVAYTFGILIGMVRTFTLHGLW